MRDNIDPIYEYAELMSGPVPAYLLEVERQTHLKTMAPQMLSGGLQGRLLALLSKLRRPAKILEFGTFTGYSALCLAEGLAPGGVLHTIEGNEETAWLARRNFAASPFAEQIVLHVGQTADVFPTLPGPFDLIFLDGDKRSYPDYYPALTAKLSPGGLLLADNILWDGKVSEPGKPDADAQALRAYNQLLADDPTMEVVVLPLRDGLSIGRKLEGKG